MQETHEIWVPSLGREMPLELERQPSPVFFPGISHGQKSLVCSPWDQKKLALTVLRRPPPGLTPTETYCPPECCLPGVRDIHSVIGAYDLLHKH